MGIAENICEKTHVEFSNPEIYRLKCDRSYLGICLNDTIKSISRAYSFIEEQQHKIEYYKAEKLSFDQRISEIERKLAKLEFTEGLTTTILDASNLVKILEKNNNFKNVYYTVDEEFFKLYVTFTNIKIKPNGINDNYFTFIENQIYQTHYFKEKTIDEAIDEILSIGFPIPDINICISISKENRTYELNSSIKQPQEYIVRDCPNISTWWPHGYNSAPMPSPHWISPNSPCLGDFGPAVNETINDCDLVATCSLIHMFLSQADVNDSAGKYWPLWIAADSIEVNVEESLEKVARSYHKNLTREFTNTATCGDCGEPIEECSCYCSETGDHRDHCGCRECDPDNYCGDCDYHLDECECHDEDDY